MTKETAYRSTAQRKLEKEVAPVLFKKCGPRCLTGPCPEGKMSCGKALEKRKEYLGEI